MNLLKLLFFLLLSLEALSYINEDVKLVIQKDYSYKEWTSEERLMLGMLLVGGQCHEEIENASPGERILDENKILRGRMMKEILYTEDLSNSRSANSISLYIDSLDYSFTSREIVKFIADNIYKFEGVRDLNYNQDKIVAIFLLVLSNYGGPEDVHLFERIEKMAPHYKGDIQIYKERVSSKVKSSDRRLTAWEKKSRGSEKEITPWWLFLIVLFPIIGFIVIRRGSRIQAPEDC